ncbi:hypothetical protein MNBD_GAMMA11-1411 [hydrothermal vent metagenome]|uniref:Uncharacterized protein n=1 Tax=hydrothermal vent metagenome TaxID=652676 RepID=A0A3B0WV51_9ZZZZ
MQGCTYVADAGAYERDDAEYFVRQGGIDNRDLRLDSSWFKITGAGRINSPEESLDYQAVVDVNPAKTKAVAERLLDVAMPVFVRGSFAQPEMSIDNQVWLNLEKSVESRKYAQLPGSYSYMKKVFISSRSRASRR